MSTPNSRKNEASGGGSSRGKRKGHGGFSGGRGQRGRGRGGGTQGSSGGHVGDRNGADKEGKEKRNDGGRRPRLDSELSEGGENCTVCLYKITIYSIGECNHPVCHACSTRMRVLCQRNECAICRRDLPKVILTLSDRKYDEIKDNIYQMDRKFKICFESDDIEKEYLRLLDHACSICEEGVSFKSFRQLDNHMRSQHQQYYCDLCVNHLRIFTHERKYYDRQGLIEHRRTGDKDDTSFKGHPLCEFCDKRFVDKDELYKHLRKDHFFCHFCDADGNQFFYSEYSNLRDHFDKDHFLCEQDECEQQKFVVFRTEIDFKAHTLDRHSNNLSKAAHKQNRRVDIDFSFNRRENVREVGREERGYNRRDGGRDDRNRRDDRRSPEYFDQVDGPVRVSSEVVPDMVADFPSLGGAGASSFSAGLPLAAKAQSGELAKKLAQSSGQNTAGGGVSSAQSWAGRGGAAPNKMEEFPSLPGAPAPAATPVVSSYKPALAAKSRPHGTAAASHPAPPKSLAQEFPGLGPPSRPQPGLRLKAKAKPVNTVSTNRPSTQSSRPASSTAHTVRPAMTGRQYSPFFDSDDEDSGRYDNGDSRALSTLSEKTVRASGQGMDYTRTDPTVSGNINIIDKSVIQALQESKITENKTAKPSSSKVDSNSIMDFPGLGPPEAPLKLTAAKKKNKQKKEPNKSNNTSTKNNNNNSKPGRSVSPGSLSSIADLLGPSPTNTNCDNKKNVKKTTHPPTSDIKPVPSKFDPPLETLNRPSKQKSVMPTPVQNGTKKAQVKSAPVLSEDFPTLGKSKKSFGATFVKAEDKLIKPPPVQSQWSKTSSSVLDNGDESSQSVVGSEVRAPPGFSAASKATTAAARPKVPPGFKERFTFQDPIDFEERNGKLIATVSKALGGKSVEFKNFRETSGKFRSGEIECDEYFAMCTKILQSKKIFADCFPELLTLLPDIDKQAELLVLYRNKFGVEACPLQQCPRCRQVLRPWDVDRHQTSHNLDADFPVLG